MHTRTWMVHCFLGLAGPEPRPLMQRRQGSARSPKLQVLCWRASHQVCRLEPNRVHVLLCCLCRLGPCAGVAAATQHQDHA